jgi:hypothetical protein
VKNRFLKAVIGSSLLFSLVYAEDKTVEKKETTPPQWWLQTSYDYPETSELLIHVEGSVSYGKKTGNDHDKSLKANALAKVRKNHLEGTMSYTRLDEDRIAYDWKGDTDPATTTKDSYKTLTTLAYDIDESFFTLVGYENARDVSFEIYNQTTKYFGAGYRAIKSQTQKLDLFGAVGSEDISFGTYPQLPSGKSDGKYVQVDYMWFINPTLTFSLNYGFFSADMEHRDKSTLVAKTQVAVMSNISLMLVYLDEYIQAQEVVQRYTHDKTVYTALKFEF